MQKKIMQSLNGYRVTDVELRRLLSGLLRFTPVTIGEINNSGTSTQTDNGYAAEINLTEAIDPSAIWYQVTVNNIEYNCYVGDPNESGSYELISEDGNVVATATGESAIVYSNTDIISASIAKAEDGSALAKSGTGIDNVYTDNQGKIHVEMMDGRVFITDPINIDTAEEIVVRDSEPTDDDSELWIMDGRAEECVLPTFAEFSELRNDANKIFQLVGAVTYWQKVQQIVRNGLQNKYFSLGDELVCNYTAEDGTVYEFPWMIVDLNREVELPDGTRKNGMILQAKNATVEKIPFDAKDTEEATEPTALEGLYYCGERSKSPKYVMLDLNVGDEVPYDDWITIYHGSINFSHAYTNGYNRWSTSVIRQWLNSSADGGDGGTDFVVPQWWTPQYTGDTAPQTYHSPPGFMQGLDDDFLEVIQPIRVNTTLCNPQTKEETPDVTYDRFFLPSIEEMYGVPYVSGEGPYWPYWKMVSGLSEPTNDSLSVRSMVAWTRSVYIHHESNVATTTYGNFAFPGCQEFVGKSLQSRPACAIY